jgi:hypothetical protein
MNPRSTSSDQPDRTNFCGKCLEFCGDKSGLYPMYAGLGDKSNDLRQSCLFAIFNSATSS